MRRAGDAGSASMEPAGIIQTTVEGGGGNRAFYIRKSRQNESRLLPRSLMLAPLPPLRRHRRPRISGKRACPPSRKTTCPTPASCNPASFTGFIIQRCSCQLTLVYPKTLSCKRNYPTLRVKGQAICAGPTLQTKQSGCHWLFSADM